ncbi:N-acetylmuramoyl-L-alanine amidase [Pelagibius sp.]|uniref:N-acetylmuramoyl-L-alanine amidase n=1 Tax=Pelagibius sp. TaxID=1931238 RepID=UPI003BB05628
MSGTPAAQPEAETLVRVERADRALDSFYYLDRDHLNLVCTLLQVLVPTIFLVLIAGSAAATPIVSELRIGQHPDKMRLVLELSEEPTYRVFTLPDPYRVVIDLPDLDWRPSAAPKVPTGVIRDLRFGLFAPGRSRVVLDADAPVRLSGVFVLPPVDGHAYRLVVDIKEVSRQAYANVGRQVMESKRPLPKASTAKRAPTKTDERITVVVDAGHGGIDPGAIGASRVYEKKITLTYAQALKHRLEATGRYRVLLTRDSDVFVKLDDRWRFAREAGAGLFLSLHADSHHSRNIRGASVFTLSSEASDEVAAALAESANKADLVAGVDLSQHSDDVSNILLDLTRRETQNLSVRYASMLVESLGKETKLLRNPHRSAGFVVLKAHDVPSVLVEIGFLSNPDDEKRLRSKPHRRLLTSAIARSIEHYFQWQQALR